MTTAETSSLFILKYHDLPLDGFSGEARLLAFSLEHYDDGLFAHFGITFPPPLARAVHKRRAEFLAGRRCAQQLLLSRGIPSAACSHIASGEDRCPIWPRGINGAISHSDDLAICAVSDYPVGIDYEPLISPASAENVRSLIMTPGETRQGSPAPLTDNQWLTLVFSAKESLFKALYPQVRHYFDFQDAEVRVQHISDDSGRLELALLNDIGAGFGPPQSFTARYRLLDKGYLTWLEIT
ncbi:4'-phosphopantetheinyl transferase family protein [Microbulbifer aggregans]|uniref:4'-phosphopantetheinyl transferase family protein n=1 Tax=Microbulbifer aggregans TaxID=1769779 RepID=UPI001CFF2B50|nr:4'-phosphopantetheinyl transferase superfamily protein [Microbulbifer aggregans]